MLIYAYICSASIGSLREDSIETRGGIKKEYQNLSFTDVNSNQLLGALRAEIFGVVSLVTQMLASKYKKFLDLRSLIDNSTSSTD